MDDITQYVAAMWEPTDLIELRMLPTVRGGFPQPESLFVFAEDIIDMKKQLIQRNEHGYNLFAGVMPRRSAGSTCDMDCLNGSMIWADFDGVEPEDALARVMEHKLLTPHMVIHSGHGTHLYWKMEKKIPTHAAAKVVHDLAHLLDADPSVANPSRIMRLPGYNNLKDPVAPTKIVSINETAIHDFKDFCELIPSANFYAGVAMPENFGKDVKPPRDRREIMNRTKSYVAAFDNTTDGGRNHAAFGLAACLQKDFALSEEEAWIILQEWNTTKCSPPLTENELYSCLVSGNRYGKAAVGSKLDTTEEPKRTRLPKAEPAVATGSSVMDLIRSEISEEIAGTRQNIPLPWKCIQNLPLLFPGKVGVITGVPGACKSYFALNLGRSIHKAGYSWQYVPLEDTKTYHTRRILAVATGSWEMTQSFAQMPERRREVELNRITNEYGDLASTWGAYVGENPTLAGKEMKALDHEDALDIISDLAAKHRVVIIDPIAQIDFNGKEEWKLQGSFMRSIVGIANKSLATILLVIHRAKRDNAGIYGVEGAKRYVDLSHTVLSVDKHMGEALVLNDKGEEVEVDCNRIMTIEKCRDSVLESTAWAFQFGSCGGPLFVPLGKIIKRAKH